MESLFVLVPLFIAFVFVLLVCSIIFRAVRGVSEWSYNNAQPVLNVSARVVTKRTTTDGHLHGRIHDHSHGRIRTSHFVTFELDSGDGWSSDGRQEVRHAWSKATADRYSTRVPVTKVSTAHREVPWNSPTSMSSSSLRTRRMPSWGWAAVS